LKNNRIWLGILSLGVSLFLLSFVTKCYATLIVFNSEGAFLSNAPTVSTETFSEFTQMTYLGSSISISSVNFTSISAGSFYAGPWTLSNHNYLCSTAIGVHDITFGQGQYVEAFGLFFNGNFGSEFRYQVEVAETNGTISQFNIYMTSQVGLYYFGVTSDIGISRILFHNGVTPPQVPDIFSGASWNYYNFSRSAILGEPGTPVAIPIPYGDNGGGVVPLPPTILLLGSGILGLAGWKRFKKS
jgi:hypothetical protein